MPAKTGVKGAAATVVQAIDGRLAAKVRGASSIARSRKTNGPIVHNEATADRPAGETASPMPVRLAPRTATAKIDITTTVRRPLRNRSRQSR